jgi:hypothetical protein
MKIKYNFLEKLLSCVSTCVTNNCFAELALKECVSTCVTNNCFADEVKQKSEAMSLNARRAFLHVACVSIYNTIIYYILLHVETHGPEVAQ